MAVQKTFIKKEVLCDCIVNDGWKEITFNSSGTPSIQDIKIPQRTGGLNISNHSNRFIFWKTRGNILELVEHSLDVNVAGNQLRYKFEDSPVLGDSISMYETKQNIVLLVATISSVHKIKFPRPKVISTRHEYVNSIFADPGAAESINNPASYHIINTASTLPYTGASYLTPEREAIFALALQSGSVAIVKINPNTEKAARVFDIKNDSFFGGLNFFSTKSRGLSQDGSILGMVVKYVKKSLYFVTLSFDGQLKCWNSEMSLVGSCDALNYCKTRNLGIQSHLIRKPAADLDPSLWIYFCLEGGNSCFMQFEVSQRGTIDFRRKATDLPHLISTQMDQLIDFLVLNNLVWCVWHTLENESVVTAYDMDSQNSETWQYAQLEPLQINPTSPALCPQGKISDLIFKPGLFSKSDVAKALEINNGNTVDLEPHLTLRQKVMLVMERDIDAKISELPDDMDEGSRAASEHFISEQIWEDFYSACIQYRKMSLPPLGMLNITSANLLLLIKKNSFSFLRPLAEIENNNPSRDISGIMTVSPRRETSGAAYRDFDKFVTSLNALSLDNNSNQEIALVLTDGKKEPGSEDLPALSGSKQFCQLLNEFAAKSAEIFEDPSELTRLRSLSDGELRVYIERFLDILNTAPPSDVVPGSQYYSSLLGVNVLTMAMNQIAELRLRLCCNLLIVLRTRESTLFNCYYKDLWRQIRDMWIITWLHNNTDANTQDSVLVSYVSASDLRHTDLIQTIQLLFSRDNSHIVQYLASHNHAVFLQDISRILDYSAWKFELMRAYLSTGQDKRAFDIVKEFCGEADLDYFIQVIDIFSKFLSCEYVIEIIHVAIDTLGSQENNSVLYSILFDNYLRLKDYPKAFDTILSNGDRAKQTINLHVLILNMLEAQESRLLLNLLTGEVEDTCRIIPEVIDFCHKRMYTFPIEQSEIYFEFLFSYHVHNAYYPEAAQVKFNQAFCYSKQLSERCECLAAAVSLMHLIDEPSRRYVNRKKDPARLKFKMYKGEKIYTELAYEQLNLSQVKNLYELEKAKAYVKDCPLDANLEEVVSLLTHNGLYKKALQLASLWKQDLRPIFVSLTSRCLQEEVSEWDWIFLNDIGDYVSSSKLDIGALMWALLEALLDIFELPGQKYALRAVCEKKYALRAVCEKIISQGYDLPMFLKRKYYALCPGEVVQLLHKHGALKSATQLSCDILTALTSPSAEPMDESSANSEPKSANWKTDPKSAKDRAEKAPRFSFSQLTPSSEQMYCGLQHIRFLQAELARQESCEAEFARLKEVLSRYETHAAKVTNEKFRLLTMY
ncbi:hypothetical protein M8J76_008701 [Diaphorina citri]|nr:hypothetical protein M8J76_008701 [Diaphorina citri]